MATGAPTPGGQRAPEAGGLRAPAAGGLDVNDPTTNQQLAAAPRVEPLTLPDTTAAGSTAIVRSVSARSGFTAVQSYAWTMPTKPGSSTATIASGAATATATTSALDLVGLYVLRCTVTFANGKVIVQDFNHTRSS